MKILSFTDADFLKQVELAVKYGLPVLVPDADEVDPILNNILSRNIQSKFQMNSRINIIAVRENLKIILISLFCLLAVAGRTFVIFGDKEIDYDPQFRIYLTTKVTNPTLDAALYAKAVVINYMVTTAVS